MTCPRFFACGPNVILLRLCKVTVETPVGVLATVRTGAMTLRGIFDMAQYAKAACVEGCRHGAGITRAPIMGGNRGSKDPLEVFSRRRGAGRSGLVTLRAKDCIEQAE